LFSGLLLMVIHLWPVSAVAEGGKIADDPQYQALSKEFDQRIAQGDCVWIDAFTDRHLDEDGAAGFLARIHAVDTLERSPDLHPSRLVCRYHDRKAALRLAIVYYEAAAAPIGNHRDPIWVTDPLAGALGETWTERLAEAGVRAAMQDLAALHLMCVRKGSEQGSSPFWEWIVSDPKVGHGYGHEYLDPLLDYFAKSPRCSKISGRGNPEVACYWNAVELALAPGLDDMILSFEMRKLLEEISQIRLTEVGDAVMAYGEQIGTLRGPRADAFYWLVVRKLIAAACAATLSPAVLEDVTQRAQRGPPSSLDELIAKFE
jgi:hypothetical protein